MAKGLGTAMVTDKIKTGLEKGRRYNVKQLTTSSNGTQYVLDGVEGVFASDSFKVVPETYLAKSASIPLEGEMLNEAYCLTERGEWSQIERTQINKVKLIYQNLYSVQTEKAIYLLQVIS